MRGQRHAPATLYSREWSVTIVQEVGWAPEPVWTGAEKLAPIGIRSPGAPTRNQSLYRLRYPAHNDILGPVIFWRYRSCLSAPLLNLPCSRPKFGSVQYHVMFVVDKMEFVQGFPQVLWSSSASIIPTALRVQFTSIQYRRFIILANYNFYKQKKCFILKGSWSQSSLRLLRNCCWSHQTIHWSKQSRNRPSN